MTDSERVVEIEVGGAADADADELGRLTSQLRRELLALDVARVERSRAGAVPAGAKAIDPVSLGALIVVLGKSAGALTEVVGTLRGWASRGSNRTVKLSVGGDVLELSGASAAEVQPLLAAWLARQEQRGDGVAGA